MLIKINLSKPKCNNVTVNPQKDGSFLFKVPHSGGYARIPLKDDITSARYLVMDVKNHGDILLKMNLHFWGARPEPAISFSYSFFPKLKTRLVLPLEALDNQKMFLKRTPGRLKGVIMGDALALDEVTSFAIGGVEYFKEQIFSVSDVYFTDTEPEYILPNEPVVDIFGQWKDKQWQGKTESEEEMVSFLQKEAEQEKDSLGGRYNKWGGWLEKRFDSGTGFFRAYKENDRWWLVDPDGYAFFSNGQDCVRYADASPTRGNEGVYEWLPPKDGQFAATWKNYYSKSEVMAEAISFSIVNLIRAFGDQWEQKWERMTKSRLMDWGVNTIGNWSSPRFIKYAKMPYVIQLEDFPSTKTMMFRDFPDVFSPEYSENSRKFAQQLKPYKDDPYLIGYFMRNEPKWAFEDPVYIAEGMLKSDMQSYSRHEFIKWISQRYSHDISKLNLAWNTSFSSFDDLLKPIKRAASLSEASRRDLYDFVLIMIERYTSIPAIACKQEDKNHLNLGMRYAYIREPALLAGCHHFDVFSLNIYQICPLHSLSSVHSRVDMPIIIGEFHHGALDKGLPATGITGVATTHDRGRAFLYYMEQAAANKWCVGAHHFILNDQPVFGRHDGENYNIGIVDICNRPYEPMVNALKKLKDDLYLIANGQKQPTSDRPDEIPRVGL